MTASSTRMDVPYLRRRLKKGEVPSGTATVTSSTSLKLGNSQTANNPATGPNSIVSSAPVSRIPELPAVEGRVVLSLEEPAVRLSRTQSAIGSLVISGAEAFAWEGIEGFGGLVLAHGEESTAPMYANRKLVEFHKGNVVVGLRHFHNIRRLIVGTRHGMLRAKLYDEAEIIADGALGANALLISRVSNQLEFRLEKINSVDLVGIFGVKLIP